MIERLTIITPKGAALKLDNPKNEKEARKQLMDKYKIAVDKLAYYEDLEAHDRLVVLPEGFDFEKLCEVVGAEDSCPDHFGLKKTSTCGNINCKDCWEKALKGE